MKDMADKTILHCVGLFVFYFSRCDASIKSRETWLYHVMLNFLYSSTMNANYIL